MQEKEDIHIRKEDICKKKEDFHIRKKKNLKRKRHSYKKWQSFIQEM